MDNEINSNINNSITLIGPICVGKSLIAKELSKKTGYPIISLDLIRYFFREIAFNILDEDKNNFKKFQNSMIEYLDMFEDGLSENPQFRDKQLDIIKDFYNIYLSHKELIGDLEQIRNEHISLLENYFISTQNTLEDVCLFQLFNNRATEIILKRLKCPVIFDMPGLFAWKLPKQTYKEDFNFFNNNSINNQTKRICEKMGTIVLLEPGQDYNARNVKKWSSINSLLLSSLSSYHEFADIIISTNGEFFEPENNLDLFQNRNTFDAEKIIAREKILNKAEIASICDQILRMQKELTIKLEK